MTETSHPKPGKPTTVHPRIAWAKLHARRRLGHLIKNGYSDGAGTGDDAAHGTITGLDDADWEICPVCFWEGDGLGASEPDEESGPNHIARRQARANFATFGACDRRLLPNVISVDERRRHAAEPGSLL
jgi:hypothetical protein